MKPLAIELNDRNVAFARAGIVLVSAPSAVFDGSDVAGGSGASGGLGGEAQTLPRRAGTHGTRCAVSRVRPHRATWASCSRNKPAAVSSVRASALVAAELSQHLAKHPPDTSERVWIAVPAQADARGLSMMLGIAQSLELAVEGFIDAAAVTVSALGAGRSSLVLELGLHHAAVTAVESGAQARRRRVLVSEQGGLIELYEAWLTFISTAMVKLTRFDPFSDADTEQQLFDALPALTREAAKNGQTVAAVSNGDNKFEVSLSRDQFAESAQPIYREIVRLLHGLRPAGSDVSLIMPESVAMLPGLREMLQQFVGCELVATPEGFAAAATSLLDLPQSEPGESVRLLRRLPLKEQPSLVAPLSREVLGRSGFRATPASHVLFEGRAIPLGASPLVVGRAPGTAAAIISLPEGLAGVSRRHCTFVRNGDELVLVDHSHYGTFVNGERVSERVRIHAGDKVRVGEPGIELSLITIGA